jgi:hypothetical protein
MAVIRGLALVVATRVMTLDDNSSWAWRLRCVLVSFQHLVWPSR